MNGKGSNRRPQSVDNETFQENWERVFGSTKPKPKQKRDCLPSIPSIPHISTIQDCIKMFEWKILGSLVPPDPN